MGILASQEERNLKWSDYSAKMKAFTFTLVGLVVVMATGLVFGVEVDNTRSVVNLFRALLGQEEVISESWLWVARLSVAAMVVIIILMRQEQRRIVEERRGATDPMSGLG